MHPDEWFHVQEIHDHCRNRFDKWDKEDQLKAMPDDLSFDEKLEELQRTEEAEGRKMEALKISRYFTDQVQYKTLALSRDYTNKSSGEGGDEDV